MTVMVRRFWTVQEEKYLRAVYGTKTNPEIGKDLKRSARSVQAKAAKLGLTDPSRRGKVRPWTPEEVAYLEKYYEKRSTEFIANKFHRTKNSVKRKAQNLGKNVYIAEDLYVKQIAYAFNCDSRVVNRWINKFGLPFKAVKRGKMIFRTINVQEFWLWAVEHKKQIPFHKYERYNLLPEPDWLMAEVRGYEAKNHRKPISWIEKVEVKRMMQQGLSHKEIAKELNRTIDSIRHISRELGDKKK